MINKENKGYLVCDKDIIQLSQRQVKKHLLCFDCEQKLGEVETRVANYFHQINKIQPIDRSWLSCIFPQEPIVCELIKENSKLINNEQLKLLNYFDQKKIEDLKYYYLSIILRQYYYEDKENLPEIVINSLENYILNKGQFFAEITLLINNNIKNFDVAMFPYSINHNSYYHTHIFFPNIFIHAHFKSDDTLKGDKFISTIDDFFDDKNCLPTIKASLDIIRRNFNDAKIANNAKKFFDFNK
ncbi:MAG: hypothetical protein O2793_13815 [Proteobacteria bacterium]|nr:hypothetical protein [Pseudomonadota bacterium]MDA1254952.1 hypothetical protein [Pseudomonadota bacterium]